MSVRNEIKANTRHTEGNACRASTRDRRDGALRSTIQHFE
jgi:hypothetical protein